MGMVVQGTNNNFKVLDHGGLLIPPEFITGPDGNAPIAAGFYDLDGDDVSDDTSLYADLGGSSLFFPNDGTLSTLNPGTYSFPLASLDASGTAFASDMLTTRAFYKTETDDQTGIYVNVVVVSGVGATAAAPQGMTNVGDVEANADLEAALRETRRIFAQHEDMALFLDVQYAVLDDPSLAVIDDDDELRRLLAAYPAEPSDDRINIYIVTAMANVDASVLGIASRVGGPFNVQGTSLSGTVVEYMEGDVDAMAHVIGHELGHYLGLWHTSEVSESGQDINGHDPIGDTPVCADGTLTTQGAAGCADASNLMFPYLDTFSTTALTPQQARVVRLNPAVRR